MKDTMYLVQDLKAKIYERLDFYKDSDSVKELLNELLGGLVAIANDLEEELINDQCRTTLTRNGKDYY